MTTAAVAVGNRTMETARPRRSLEELVGQLFEAIGLGAETETAEPSAAWTIHKARRLRQSGDIYGALTVLSRMDMAEATPGEVRWAFSEWSQVAGRRFGDRDALVYSPGAGRAAVLIPRGDGSLEVAAALGMRWKAGKSVSRRSLRGLRPLA